MKNSDIIKLLEAWQNKADNFNLSAINTLDFTEKNRLSDIASAYEECFEELNIALQKDVNKYTTPYT